MPRNQPSPIEDLAKRLPPPKQVAPSPPASFDATESALGLRLPDDVKALVARYGGGKIDGFVRILDVRAAAYVAWVRQVTDAMREAGDVPGPYYPQPGGLLPMASTDNGDTICLRTVGTPSAWTVLVAEGRGPDTFEFQGGVVAFLDAVLKREIECTIFPESFPAKKSRFETEPPPKFAVSVALGESEIPFRDRKAQLHATVTSSFRRAKVTRDAPLLLRIDLGAGSQVEYLEHVPGDGGPPGSDLRASGPPNGGDRMRKVLAAFVKSAGLSVHGILDNAGQPIWPEGL